MGIKYADILRGQVANLEDERDALRSEVDALTAETETRDLKPEEDERITAIVARGKEIATEIEAKLARAAELDALDEERNDAARQSPTFIRKPDAPAPTEVRNMGVGEVRSAAMRVVDAAPDFMVEARQKAHLERLFNIRNNDTDGDQIARRLLLTENEAYRSGFVKSISRQNPIYTTEEQRALLAFEDFEARAASSSSASGGYGVPVLIDPTIILTSGAVDAPVLSVCRIETITTDTWKGVSSTAAAWSTDAEGSAVSDDMVTLAQPSVSVYEARAFIPFSIRIGMDYPNFAAEMAGLLAQGYVDYLSAKTMTGSGSDIQGIFTALDANTNVEVVVTSDGVFQAADIDKVWAALQRRFRRSSHWLMNVDVENEIRGFGSGTATSRFTVDQMAEGIGRLNGRPVLTDDYAPLFTGTTGAANILVVGDFKNYLLAQRAGMSIELVPHVFDVTDNRPTGQRGWFAYARVGGDSINDNAFRLLQNT